MNYTAEKLEKSQVKFHISHDKQEYAAATVEAYNKTKHKYSVPGFRKGHVPQKVLEGMYGPAVFMDEAVNILIDGAISELEQKGEYQLIAFGSVEDVDFPDGGVSYNLTMVVRPEVELGQYKGLGLTQNPATVTDEQVDNYVEADRHKQARKVDLDGEAKMGDIVLIDYRGEIDGVAFEGGTATDHELKLGSHSFIDGFEEGLVGVKKGDSKDVNVTFPADYHAAELAGKEAVFHCDVKNVFEEVLPELNDDFAKEISEFDTFEEYKSDVKAKLLAEAEAREKNRLESEIVDKIVQNATVEIPDVLIKEQQDEYIAGIEENMKQYYGTTIEQYYNATGTTREKLAEMYKDRAVTDVKTRLVLETIVEKENITLEEGDLDKRIEEIAQRQYMTVDELKKVLTHDNYHEILNSIISDKLFDMLIAENTGEQKAEKPAKKTTKKAAKADELVSESAADEKPAKKTTKKAVKTEEPVAEPAADEKPAKKAAKADEQKDAPTAEEKPAKKTTKKAVKDKEVAEAPAEEKPAKKTSKKSEKA